MASVSFGSPHHTDWESEKLGRIVQRYAPQAFGGRPLPAVTLSAEDARRLYRKRLPNSVIVAEIDLVVGAWFYLQILGA